MTRKKRPPLSRGEVAYLLGDGTRVEAQGWIASPALGATRLDGAWAIVMRVSGLVLASGFPTLEETGAFCEAATRSRTLGPAVGETTREEFLTRAGGETAAREAVARCRENGG